MKNTTVLKFFGVLFLTGVITFFTYAIFAKESLEKKESISNSNSLSSLTNVPFPVSAETSLQASQKREGAPSGFEYQVKESGERCAIVNLNHYIPANDEVGKTYTWIIEFPADPCVIQQPATNLPEKLGETQSENIVGTSFRRTVVKYE